MTRTVTVTGHGAAQVVPDAAVLRVAAVQRAASVGPAFAAVSSTVRALTDIARTVVDDAAIASRDLNVWPAHDAEGRPVGFECRHALEIRCPSLEEAGSLLSEAVAQIGERMVVEQVSLEATDTKAAESAAREAAYADAVARATQLASLAETELGSPVAIAEGGALSVGREAFAASMAKADVGFAPGERSISASLTITFSLESERRD